MIKGIGIDSTEIARFKEWATRPKPELLKILSEQEIDYCLNTPAKTAERFAARFATKEAFFKAFGQMAPGNKIPFLTLCKAIWLESAENQPPKLNVDWKQLLVENPPKVWISITHTETTATAMAVLESAQ